MANSTPLFAITDKSDLKRQIFKVFDDGSIHVYPEAGQDFTVLTDNDAISAVVQFADGVWIGNEVIGETSGNFVPQVGYNGIFVYTNTAVAYMVNGTIMTELNGLARFA